MKIGVLGAGSWGFTLSVLLALKEYEVVAWTAKPELMEQLNETRVHPLFPQCQIPENIRWTNHIDEAIFGKDLVVESVTSKGLRPVFQQIDKTELTCPVVITSKGVEQTSMLPLPEVLLDVLGEEFRDQIGILSGPSFAKEVIQNKPTSVVASAYSQEATNLISQSFNSPLFRVYPNSDIIGVAYGGAGKNVIAVACGISDGMQFGMSARAALITRGLHELRKLALAKGGKESTLNGLSGMGDLIVTCSSPLSRNYSYGKLLAQGVSSEEAKDQIGMVVEGAYTAKSLFSLCESLQVAMPITEAVYQIIYENLSPKMAVQQLMQRTVKEEHL